MVHRPVVESLEDNQRGRHYWLPRHLTDSVLLVLLASWTSASLRMLPQLVHTNISQNTPTDIAATSQAGRHKSAKLDWATDYLDCTDYLD